MDTELIILHLGLYNGGKLLQEALRHAEKAQIVDLTDTEGMTDPDWDKVIKQMQGAQRCITL